MEWVRERHVPIFEEGVLMGMEEMEGGEGGKGMEGGEGRGMGMGMGVKCHEGVEAGRCDSP